jgi:hypothetical protein
VIITQADIDAGKVKDAIRHMPSVTREVGAAARKLAGQAQVSSDLRTYGGAVHVRVRIKLAGSNEYAHWFEDEQDLRDCKHIVCIVLGLHYKMGIVPDELFDPNVDWKTAGDALAGAMYELVYDVAQPDVDRLHGRVLRLLDKRSKTVPEMSKRARAAWVKEVMDDVRDKLRLVRAEVQEQDVVDLWREVLCEETQDS